MTGPDGRQERATPQEAAERAARRALLAPSVHNTQPWRIELHDDRLDLYADTDRSLPVLDPRHRQLTISCGCALFNARAAIAADGYRPIVVRFPDARRPDLLARVVVGEPTGWQPVAPLDDVADRRHTNRRVFLDPVVPPELLDAVTRAARDEDTHLVVVDPARHDTVARLGALADEVENSDDRYRAELDRWVSDDPRRPDGLQAAGLPHGLASTGSTASTASTASAASAPADDSYGHLHVRAFDGHGVGWLPSDPEIPGEQTLLLFCTDTDGPRAWLRAGEALERAWLELARHEYSASPLSQLVEVRDTCVALRDLLGLESHPQVLLRAGRAPAVPATPRRAYEDVVSRA
ncbi:Acg family FMN-binding oxidoreductase [Jatrophihabitans fulvus]